ncbi:MAG: SemiSWEET transporter [Saprospiraceae bacterium]
MELDFINLLGFVAACLTTGAFIPQVIKTWKTRSTGDLSLGMFLMLFLGTTCWFIYGLLKMDLPLIGANGITLSLAFVILYFKLKELKKKAV